MLANKLANDFQVLLISYTYIVYVFYYKFCSIQNCKSVSVLTLHFLEQSIAKFDGIFLASIMISEHFAGVLAVSIENLSPLSEPGDNLLQPFARILSVKSHLIILIFILFPSIRKIASLYITEVFMLSNHLICHFGHFSVCLDLNMLFNGAQLENFGEFFE